MNRWKRWLFIIIVTAAAVCLLILAGLAFFNIFEGSKAVMPIHSPMVKEKSGKYRSFSKISQTTSEACRQT